LRGGDLFAFESSIRALSDPCDSDWQSKRAFEAWTKSKEFRAAHERAGNKKTGPLYLEHPKFEGFEVRQTITRKAA
jgi:heme-degrading monooxygenase HmoA